MKMSFTVFVVFTLFYSIIAAPQQPEINDQFEAPEETTQTQIDEIVNEVENVTAISDNVTAIIQTDKPAVRTHTEIKPHEGVIIRIYKLITEPIIKVLFTPKVNHVLRNIGTCAVNGAMELISYYLPAPFIPLIASAAGLVIPFEPIVMLKQKMPVASYRRAFQTAMNTFMNTFDKYKVDEEFDPYMTRRFNRRFMNNEKRD